MRIVMANTLWARLRGLKGRNEDDGVLMLTPCNDIHTFGMRRPIDVAFVTNTGLVLEAHRGIGKRRRLRCKMATFTLERFASDEPWVERGDRLEFR